MRKLYHYPISPFSRKVRVMLAEKELPCEVIIENFWERRREFLAMNPAAQVPVLKEADGSIYADSTAICEYLDERYGDDPQYSLIGRSVGERAETRRIAAWFNNKFYYEVTKYILDEKVYKHYRRQGEPDSGAIRAAKSNILYHLDYIAHLTREHKWLAGERYSIADITAASHISVLDYFSDVPWNHSPAVKEWYALAKSRPGFRLVLEERIPGFRPPSYYDNPDF